MQTVREEQKETLKRVDNFLDEGFKSLDERQQHIKVADQLDYGWATIKHYNSHPQADNSDDKKHVDKAEKEAERVAGKHRCGGGVGTKGRHFWSDSGGPSSRSEPQPEVQTAAPLPPVLQGQSRPWVLGPYYPTYSGPFIKATLKGLQWLLASPVIKK